MSNLHSIKSRETRVCKNVSSKNKGRCRDGAVFTCKVWQTTWRKYRRNREEGRSMQQGGGPVHGKPRSLSCADFEYVFTIPTSANILLRLLLLHAHSSSSASPLHPQVQPYNFPIFLLYLLHVLCTLVIRFILANCLLLNLLCCALESRPSCSSMQFITCFDVTASCRTHILWIHHLCSCASCSTLRPWKITQLSY